MKSCVSLSVVALCVLLSGCAQDFPEQAYTEQERGFVKMLQDADDYDSRLALARLYFEHNELDEADALLRVLVAEDPDNAEALAWYGANNCKLAGRAQPWLLGMYKLYQIHACLGEVRQAAAMAPDDLTVQLVLVNTGAAVDMFGSLESARAALERLLEGDTAEGDRYPHGPRAHIFLAAAQVSQARDQRQAAMDYLERVIALKADERSVGLARERLSHLQEGG